MAAVPRMPVVSVPLDDALGLVCVQDIVAAQTVPPFANCSLDGYAVRRADVEGASADAPVELAVLGMVPAGSVADRPVEPGRAWKVMTGAPLPPGADTVVMVELTSATRESPLAGEGDVVFYAGPGHEDYQEVAGVHLPYSAREDAKLALREAGWLS